jgi:thiamine biosynthesis lipoprotein
MNRRDFLHIREAVRSAGAALQPPADPAPEAVSLLRVGRRAMATSFEVLVPWGTPDGQAAAEAALDLVDRLEAQLTVYRDASEVSRLNRLAAVRPVPVEAGLFALLQLCERLAADTGGAFDPTSGPLIKAWGFFRRQGRVPADDEIAAARDRVGILRFVELDVERRTVRFRRAGVEVNFGSIGKGYALDRATGMMGSEFGVTSALLHAGGSSVLAVGTPPGDRRGWEVGVRHPWRGGRLGVVRLAGRALATSAATYQHFDYNGRKLGHLLDPRTGRPAEGVASATAIAPTAAEADALATAFYVLGSDAVRDYCAARPDVAAVVLPDAADAPLAFNLTAAEFDATPADDDPPPPDDV